MTGNKNIDSVFRDSLLNFEERPPIDAWENISDTLDAKYKQKRTLYLRAVAATVAVFLSFAAGYFISQEKSKQPDFAQSNNKIFKAKDYIYQRNIVRENNTNDLNSNSLSYYSSSTPNKKEISNSNSSNHKNSTGLSKVNESPQQIDLSKAIIKEAHIETNLRRQVRKEIRYVYNNSYPLVNDYAPEEYIEDSDKNNNTWSLGGDLAPVYSYRTANDKANVFDTYNNDFQTTNEKGLLTYSGGINLGYKVNNKLTIQSGVYYAEIGHTADNVHLQAEQPILEQPDYTSQPNSSYIGNTSAGKVNTTKTDLNNNNETTDFVNSSNMGSMEVDNLEQNFQYIEIPLIAKYKIIDKKIDFQLIGGLNTGMLIGNNLYKRDGIEKDRIGETENINKYIYNTITGVGFEYNLNNKLTLNLEPTMKYSIMSINETQDFHYRPYSFGIFTGVSYRFK